jgi:hypothetical protein
MKELEVYAENTRSLLLYMNLHLLRIDNPDALSAASHLGRCIGICDVIKKIPFFLAKHRGYIPTETLLKVGPISPYLNIFSSSFSTTSILRRFGIHGGKASSLRSSLMLSLSKKGLKVILLFGGLLTILFFFRVSAYAKKHLEVGREYRDKLPK